MKTTTTTTVVGQPSPQRGFNENDPIYRCFWNCCNMRTAVLVVGTVEIICIILQLIYAILTIHTTSNVNFALSIVWTVLFGAVIALMFFGVKAERSNLFVPHLVVSIVAILFCIVWCILAIIAATRGGGDVMELLIKRDSICHEQAFSEKEKSTMAFLLHAMGNVLTAGACAGIEAVASHVAVTIVAAGCAVGAILEIWFFTVILRYYLYIRSKEATAAGYAPIPKIESTI